MSDIILVNKERTQNDAIFGAKLEQLQTLDYFEVIDSYDKSKLYELIDRELNEPIIVLLCENESYEEVKTYLKSEGENVIDFNEDFTIEKIPTVKILTEFIKGAKILTEKIGKKLEAIFEKASKDKYIDITDVIVLQELYLHLKDIKTVDDIVDMINLKALGEFISDLINNAILEERTVEFTTNLLNNSFYFNEFSWENIFEDIERELKTL